MSRGFVKEDDQEDIPMIPPRAYLPPGITNYVTPEGLEALNKEKQDLLQEREKVSDINEKERRIARNVVDAKIRQLEERIASARVIDNKETDLVRFGNWITLEVLPAKQQQRFRIVGVDEADIRKGKISFISPLARGLVNKASGDEIELHLPAGNKRFRILEISSEKE